MGLIQGRVVVGPSVRKVHCRTDERRAEKKINQEFRKNDKPTNVLSFGNLDENIIQKYGLEKAIGNNKYIFLGDIILSYEYILKEAESHNKNS